MSVKKIPGLIPARRASPKAPNETNARFTPIVKALCGDATVSRTRMFGSTGLKVNGKVFAMLVKDDLVVKLPKERVEALISAKLGKYFDPGHGRLMKEWVAIQSKAEAQWLKLAKEAQKFVVSRL